MNRGVLYTIVITLILIALIILQSVLYPYIQKVPVISELSLPDLSLIAIVYFSINRGRIVGQTMGFVTGFILDAMGSFSYGINSMARLIIGFGLGIFKGKIFLDKFILPIILISVTTLIKYLLFHLIGLIFPVSVNYNILSLKFLEELIFNLILTPFIFMLFNITEKKYGT